MFNKNVRKRLQEHSWLDIKDQDKNPSQAYRRFRDNALESISDLSLLASKLPDDKLYEIFNEKTLGHLLNSIFFFDKSEEIPKVRQPNLQLASYLAKKGIGYCLSEFRELNKDTPASSLLTIEYLQRAIQICEEISSKSLRRHVERDLTTSNQKLICIWEDKFTIDHSKFEKYIYEEIDLIVPDLMFETIKTNKINEFCFAFWAFDDDPEEKVYVGKMTVTFSMDKEEGFLFDNNNGIIRFYDQQDKEIKSKNVKILQFGSEHALIEAKK